MLINYKEQIGIIIDTIKTSKTKKIEKIDKFQSLRFKLKKLWRVKIMGISVAVCALVAIAYRLPGWLAAQILEMTSDV